MSNLMKVSCVTYESCKDIYYTDRGYQLPVPERGEIIDTLGSTTIEFIYPTDLGKYFAMRGLLNYVSKKVTMQISSLEHTLARVEGLKLLVSE